MATLFDHDGAGVRPVPLRDALSERYLAYALSTITARSLPDVRDGLKPVQRRLLHAMRELRLDPAGAHKKCARVVGDVIGKYHPHGDAAVYEALVRLAQEFAQRYPLVDGQGNFGNVDGDNAAAMRYTEARLTGVAAALLEGIDEDAVDFRPNYDGSDEEPVVLPAAFPNLLANGASGIAVGMATSIPPHNAGEVCAALIHLIEHPAAGAEDLLDHLKGPDFPTGGVLVEPRAQVVEAYRTGRGGFRLRARWEREDLSHGQYQIVVAEIPYQVQKSRLVERIAELLAARKLPLLADVRDESAEDVRLVLVPRSRTVPAEQLMEQLFRTTELEVRVPLNMNVLDANGVPGVMGLPGVLRAFVEHRLEVLVRRSRHRLAKIDDRLEVLDGFLVVFLNLDEVIRIVREEDDPKAELIRTFDLTERQAEAILNMRLRNLRRLEEEGLRKEQRKLQRERKGLAALLKDEGKRRARLVEELADVRDRLGDPRRTGFAEVPVVAATEVEAAVERFPVTVVCSRQGWVRVQRGHLDEGGERQLRYKEGDGPRFSIRAQSTDKLLLAATDGRCFVLPIERLPGGRGMGEPLRVHIELARGADVADLLVHRPEGRVLVASNTGRGFVAEEAAIASQTRGGRQVLNLDAGERLAAAVPLDGDHVALLGENRKMLILPLAELPVMARGKGVRLQRYREGGLADARAIRLAEGLSWTNGGGRTRTVHDLSPWVGHRGSAGLKVPQGFPRDDRLPR